MVSDKTDKHSVSQKDEKKSTSHKEDDTAPSRAKSPAEKSDIKSNQRAGKSVIKGGGKNAPASAATTKPSPERKSASKPATTKPAVVEAKDSADKLNADKANNDKLNADKANNDKLSADKANNDKLNADKANNDVEPEREPLLLPREVDVDQDPNAPAPAPRRAPRGDARSFRRADEFCFVYRHHQFLIRRQGKLGKMGQWSMVEYPSQGSAAHAYAEICSELTGEGFIDFRG